MAALRSRRQQRPAGRTAVLLTRDDAPIRVPPAPFVGDNASDMPDAPVADSPTAPEPAYPYPPRYWWLTRLSALVVLLGLALAGLRWWWGNHADRKMDAVIAAAHARGEKILVADYQKDQFLPDD